ncbi:MAG TPA: Ig-like domain-containing protein, partial [Gemmatimonadaceae bacterium]|nr:Ig-like domain-containing protein [Gemmatimonadaceae bacterium]
MRRLIAVALLGSGCASPGIPPGGPIDVTPPQLVAIIPDSGAVGVKPKEVVFRFDETVAERPPSVTTLSDLFLISPRDGVPEASWHRGAIGVRPTHGWRANTPYTVIMMSGLADLRGNVRKTGASTFFSTGTTIPRTRLAGNVFDWVSGAPATGALVESFVPPDSVHPYVAIADSNGAFVIEHLPPARYIVRAYLDRNKNLGIDPSEPWDSVSINLTDSARTELVIFAHDTVAPRLRDVRLVDSLTLHVTFDRPVNPSQTLTAANFAVIGPDSSRVPIVSAGPPPKDTTTKVNPPVTAPSAIRPPARGRAPTPGGRDTTLVPKPVMPRPVPISDAVIKLQHPLTPKLVYHVRAIGIRGLLGRTGDSQHTFSPPAP